MSAYAYIAVEAEGRRHDVFNIGMDVPAVRSVIERTAGLLPSGAEIGYDRLLPPIGPPDRQAKPAP